MKTAPLSWLAKIGGDTLKTKAKLLSSAINELNDSLSTKRIFYVALDGNPATAVVDGVSISNALTAIEVFKLLPVKSVTYIYVDANDSNFNQSLPSYGWSAIVEFNKYASRGYIRGVIVDGYSYYTGVNNNAISGWRDFEVIGTLAAGSTSITLSNSAISTHSTIDIYTDTYGVDPTDVSVATGAVTLTFDAQSTAMGVKVRVS